MSQYNKALEAIWSRINVTPPMHQSDFEAIIDLFDRMLRSGKRVNSVDDIGNYLTKKGMDEDMAHDIQMIYEVLEALRCKIKGPLWDEEFIKDLL